MKKCIVIFLIVCTMQTKTAQDIAKLENLKHQLNENCSSILSNILTTIEQHKSSLKEATIMVYIAADNDLHYFAWKNIKELSEVAPPNINIIVQLNEPGKHKKTQRYLITKGKAHILNKDNQEKLDSGSAKTLIDFCTYSIKNFPAQDYVLILWDHGTGILDPRRRTTRTDAYFHFNASNLMIEVDRSRSFLDLVEKEPKKGICFDDHYNTYLTNEKLDFALNEIQQSALEGKKFAIIGMDACLMSMIEVANLFKKYCNIMVASQEVELGAGWRYDKILKYFDRRKIEEFAKHIVESYREAYESINADYTLSAINLSNIDELESNIDQLATELLNALRNQTNNSVHNLIKKSKEKISFDEPSYIDLYSFCELVANGINGCTMENAQQTKYAIKQKATNCLKSIEKATLANSTGRNVAFAKGISIYLPEKNRGIHTSYRATKFAKNNNWINFITTYIMS